MSGLRDLDDRFVPRAAARLRASVERARGRRAALRARVARVTASGLPAAADGPAGALRRLDDRFARSGPLGVVRDVPQVGVVVIAAVFLAGAGVALARSGDEPSRGSTGQSSQAVPASRVLGPEVGASVPGYVRDVAARAAAASQDRPGGQHVALVSLTEHRTPEQLSGLVDGLDVERAYLTVPSSDPSEVLSADVVDLAADLRDLYATTSKRKAEDAQEFVDLAATIDAANAEQRRFKEFYELSARLASREAEAYRTGCACVFAVVVRGTAATLAALPALAGVRAVELGPRGVPLGELRVRPLGPEQTSTVSAGADPREPS